MSRKPVIIRTLDEIRALTESQLAEVGVLLTQQNRAELEALAKNPDTPILKLWFASVAVKAISKGDMSALDTLLDRILGRPKASVDVQSSVTVQTNEPALTPIERDARIAELERLDKLLGTD